MIGNFELDLRGGEVRYKGGLKYANGVVTKQMVWQLSERCANTMDLYFPGIMKIVYADIEPVDAILGIESSQATGSALL